ncbi:MAG: LysR family transcriptional regulator [Rhodospirillales bacterium]
MYPSIQTMRAMVHVARSGQFGVAASRLNLSPSAVSHQIARLERQLATRLFVRTRNGVTLTGDGERFLQHVDAALKEIEAGVEAVSPQSRHKVAITSPRTLSALWLAPRLPDLHAWYPEIELQMISTDRVCDLKREHLDFAIRRVADVPAAHEHLFFCSEEITPVANPDIASRIKNTDWSTVSGSVPFLVNATHPEEWALWSAATGIHPPPSTRFKTLETYDLVQAAATAGLGIAMGRMPLCMDALSDGRIERLFHSAATTEKIYSLLWRSDRSLGKAQRKFLEWVMNVRPEPAS